MACGVDGEGFYVDTCLGDAGPGRWILFSPSTLGPIW